MKQYKFVNNTKLLDFTWDGKHILISTELLKKIMLGRSKEAMQWFIHTINTQDWDNEETRRWNRVLDNPSVQWNYEWGGKDEFPNKPICHMPDFDFEFAKWLLNIELPEVDLSMIDKLSESNPESKGG